MLARTALASAALLLGAACSDRPSEPIAAPGDVARTETPRPATEPVAPSTQPADPGAALPPANAERRYVGRWATRADLCEGGAWVFARDSFGMEDGPMCEFARVGEIAGGYRIEANCEEPRGERRQSTFTLTFAESARAMLVEDLASLPDTGLVYCGPS